MRPGWVAGITRGRLLLLRTIGAEQARTIAACRSLGEGLSALAGSAYGERVRVGEGLVAAERAVAETLLWHMRILAGWLPAAGAGLVRALAGWLELQNIDARLAALASDGHEPTPLTLGGLATAWPAIERARSVDEVADAVAGSPWGRVPGRSAAELALGLRVAWARRVWQASPRAMDWVVGAAALLVARERLLAGKFRRTEPDHIEQLSRLPGITEQALHAGSLQELRSALPVHASWALANVSAPTDLWRAELAWWDRVEHDARGLLRGDEGEEGAVLGSVALLAVDARRTILALQSAAHGGGPNLVELVGGAA